jgi:regulator of protease activity HflC (stomatin/prohibitin superfamily)
VGAIVVGTIAAISGPTAVAVHNYDQREIKRIEGERKSEVARVEGERKSEVARVEGDRKSEVARVEGDRKLSEQFWKAEVERYKHDLQLAHTQDYEPYQAAVSKKMKKKRGGTGGLEKEEEKD